jgi:chemotaxis protein methyltransferase CheR
MLNMEEIEMLLNDVYEHHGYDFSNYAEASLKRRVNRLYQLDKFPSFAEFRYRVKNDSEYIRRFVEQVTVNVTEMFRDPGFYKHLRNHIIPNLAPKPFIRIWHAGCSTGEEVVSMAILLKEENLLQKSLLYATDLNPDVLEKARAGFYPMQAMQSYSSNYVQSGGKQDFSSYYAAKYDHAKFDEELMKKIIFSTHNLVSDRSFNSFDLIICRNVLIYFDNHLQERVLKLFDESLEKLGYLALGSKENLRFTSVGHKYRQEGREKIWRKIH